MRARRHHSPTRRAVGSALLAVVGTDHNDALIRHVDRFGTQALISAARQHGVEGFLDLALRRIGASTDATRIARLAAAADHLRACHLLAEVAAALDTAGVSWVAVKGPVLSGHYYERSDLRRYVDLDILVHPRDFPAALLAVEGMGGTVDKADWPVAETAAPAEMLVECRGGVPVDLHWNLVSAAADRRRLRLPSAQLLNRRRHVDVGGTVVPTLDPVDTLLHVALHAARSGGARLVWLVDIDRVTRAGDAAWSELVRRAQAARVGPQVGLMLRRARSHVGTPVPDQVLADLGPAGSWLWLQKVMQRWTPVGVARTDRSALRLVTRATDSGSATSWATMAAHSLGWLGARRPALSHTPPVGDTQPSRQRYLAMVARQS